MLASTGCAGRLFCSTPRQTTSRTSVPALGRASGAADRRLDRFTTGGLLRRGAAHRGLYHA